MARFCVNCGKEIKKEDAFCPECGTKVDESFYPDGRSDAPTQALPVSNVKGEDVTLGSKPNEFAAVPPQANTYASVEPGGQVATPHDSGRASGGKGVVIGVLSTIVVVLLLLVVLLVTGVVSFGGNDHGAQVGAEKVEQDQGSSTNESDGTSEVHEKSHEETSDGTSSGTKKKKDSSRATDEEIEFYENLAASYKKLGSLSDEINTTHKSAFNNYATKKDRNKRQLLYDSAMSEYDKVNQAMGDLETLESAASQSELNGAKYDEMLTCYGYCLNRIKVICDAWEISMKYDDPKGHEDEICEPLKEAQYDEKGTKHKGNVDLQRFKSLYPKCKPLDPEKV